MNQVLFRVWESVDLLSNEVWHLFLSRIDGKINGEAWELKITNRGEKEEQFSILPRTERLEKKREPLERNGKGINTLPAPTVS